MKIILEVALGVVLAPIIGFILLMAVFAVMGIVTVLINIIFGSQRPQGIYWSDGVGSTRSRKVPAPSR